MKEQLNPIWDSRLDPDQKKGISGKTGKIQIRSTVYLIYCTSVNFLDLITIQWLYKTLTLDEAGRGNVETLSYFCNLSV